MSDAGNVAQPELALPAAAEPGVTVLTPNLDIAAANADAIVEQPSEAPVTEAPAASPTAVEPDGDSASETPAEAPAAEGADGAELDPGVLTVTEPEKPAEATPPDSEEKKPEAETPPVEVAAPEPVKYEAFTLPEGLTATEELEKFAELAGGAQVPQETAQQLLDMHVAEIQRLREHESQEQHRVWNETRRNWRNEIMADEELGGAGFETNRATASRMLDLFVPEDRRGAFNQALIATGMTDHPEFFRFLVNVARKFDEPSPAPLPRNPPPDIGRNPSSGRRIPYTHPTSPRPNGAA